MSGSAQLPTDAPLPAVTWGPQPSPTAPKGSARTRSRWAIATVALAGALGAVAFVQDVIGLGVFESAFAGTLPHADALAFDSAFAAVGTLQLLVLIAAAVAVLAWLSRSVDNIPRLTGTTPKFSPRWSIGWWFIPFANFVMPYLIVADVYRRMAPVARVSTMIVGAWWVIWIVGNIISNAAGRVWLAGDDLAELTLGLQLFAIGDIMDAVAAVLVIQIILRIQGWADARELAPTSPPEPIDAATLATDAPPA